MLLSDQVEKLYRNGSLELSLSDHPRLASFFKKGNVLVDMEIEGQDEDQCVRICGVGPGNALIEPIFTLYPDSNFDASSIRFAIRNLIQVTGVKLLNLESLNLTDDSTIYWIIKEHFPRHFIHDRLWNMVVVVESGPALHFSDRSRWRESSTTLSLMGKDLVEAVRWALTPVDPDE